MNTALTIHIYWYADADSGEPDLHATRSIALPFVPWTGLQLQLRPPPPAASPLVGLYVLRLDDPVVFDVETSTCETTLDISEHPAWLGHSRDRIAQDLTASGFTVHPPTDPLPRKHLRVVKPPPPEPNSP